MTAYEIPLTPEAQTFAIALGAVTYNLTFYWNPASACWMLNLADSLNNPILMGIPVVTGLDLLAQYAYLGIAGAIVVQTDHNPLVVPTFTNLGLTGHVFFVTG